MARSYYDDWDDFDDYYDPYEEEERERRAHQTEVARLQAMTPEQLGKEWSRHCRRHDSAVDRCEQINSPTIEDAAGWMRFIENELESRGLRYFDYTGGD
jgi:hypothetical protein